jgi:hypothetical protein
MEFKSGEIQDSSYPDSMTLLRLRIMVIRLRGLIESLVNVAQSWVQKKVPTAIACSAGRHGIKGCSENSSISRTTSHRSALARGLVPLPTIRCAMRRRVWPADTVMMNGMLHHTRCHVLPSRSADSVLTGYPGRDDQDSPGGGHIIGNVVLQSCQFPATVCRRLEILWSRRRQTVLALMNLLHPSFTISRRLKYCPAGVWLSGYLEARGPMLPLFH